MKTLGETMDAVLITGPTASGKSALALELADRHNGVVVNADSMQVYDTLHVLTARPSASDMSGIDHRLYGHVSPLKAYSTGQWLRACIEEIARIRAGGKMPVVVGGTGLYFKALTGGLSAMPEVPGHIREELRNLLELEGSQAMHRRLDLVDPEMAVRLNPSDGQRIVRALEIRQASGRSILHFMQQAGAAVIDPASARKIIVLPDRAVLHQRINRRFEAMLESGALEEVRALVALELAADLPAMKAIGVRQIAEFLAGRMNRDTVIAEGAAATRQYAKRQMTWFRNQMDESWQRSEA